MDTELKRLAETTLEQHWSGGELPAGPSVSDSFRQNVDSAKTLARGVLSLLAELERRDEELSIAQAQLLAAAARHPDTVAVFRDVRAALAAATPKEETE